MNRRLHWILLLSVLIAAMLACSKKEEEAPAPAPPPAAAPAPQVGAEHAKDEAHQGVVETHEAMKESHEGMKEAHEGMKEMHEGAMASMETGKAVYEKSCAACHDTGVSGAPKLGDKAAWAPHIAEGLDHLVEVAIKGEGAMPAKGGNPALTDEEIRAAVTYMLDQSR